MTLNYNIQTQSVTLQTHQVKLYSVDQLDLKSQLDQVQQYLSVTELQRLASLTHKAVHQQFIVSRGILRYILSQYTGQAPAAIDIKTSAKGKPYIEPSAIYFNVSHSAARLVVAISTQVQVGVDIEFINKNRQFKRVVQRYFTQLEQQQLAQQSVNQYPLLFYKYWTAKEAWAKCIGVGLNFPFQQHCVQKAMVSNTISVMAADLQPTKLSFSWVDVGPDYQGCIAIL